MQAVSRSIRAILLVTIMAVVCQLAGSCNRSSIEEPPTLAVSRSWENFSYGIGVDTSRDEWWTGGTTRNRYLVKYHDRTENSGYTVLEKMVTNSDLNWRDSTSFAYAGCADDGVHFLVVELGESDTHDTVLSFGPEMRGQWCMAPRVAVDVSHRFVAASSHVPMYTYVLRARSRRSCDTIAAIEWGYKAVFSDDGGEVFLTATKSAPIPDSTFLRAMILDLSSGELEEVATDLASAGHPYRVARDEPIYVIGMNDRDAARNVWVEDSSGVFIQATQVERPLNVIEFKLKSGFLNYMVWKPQPDGHGRGEWDSVAIPHQVM